MKIISLNIGKPKEHMFKDQPVTSGVGKQKVSKAFLSKDGFQDDGAHLSFHGGPDRAVLFYCYDHYQTWNELFKKKLQIPGFGENLTVSGLSEDNVWIGDSYQIGEAVIQITQPRIPCNTLSNYNNEDALLGQLVKTGYTGFLGRVLKEGWIEEDSSITLLERIGHSVSIKYANAIYFHDQKNKQGIEKILGVKELAEVWKEQLEKRLQKLI